jgi:hypothetical protein
MITVFPSFHHLNSVCKAFNFNFSYLVKISRDSVTGPAPRLKRVQLELEFGLEVDLKELHLLVNLGMQYLIYVQYRRE